MYLARLAEQYTGRRYDCQYLSKYLSEDIASSSEVLELLEQASDGRIAPIFLVSALSSGRSLRTYVEAFGTLFEDEKPSVVTVYLLGQSLAPDLEASIDVLVLCSLADILEARGLHGLVDDVSLEEGQKIFTIDAQTYFPRYFEPKEHRFTPSKFTAKSKQFFETYAGYQIFSVCKDGSSNTKLNLRRHHAFHVDILKLVSSNEFRVRIAKLVKSLDRPTHIVHLKKPADARFAQVVSECFPDDSPIDLIECSGYRRIPKRQDILRVLADPNANVWFLDAMYISGQSTAQDFEQGLRSGLSTQGLSEYPSRISFLVGLLRPDLSAKITSDNGTMIRLSCPTRHGEIVVNSVEEVLLPNWDHTQCPWCKERELHTLLLSKHALDGISGKEKAYIEGRLTLLAEGRRQGLRNNLFFKRYPEHQFEFNKGSLWFDWSVVREKGLSESEADIMLAVASALQYWRDDYGSMTPAQYLLDQQSCFGVNVYNESFLRAAIWRSLKRREVDTFLNDSYRKELLLRVFDAGGAADATDEFVLGWEASKLLGRYLPRVIGKDRFDAIDWNYLKWTCLAI